MSDPKRPPSSPDTLPPYHALDPIPQPEVTERNSDTTWELWNNLRKDEEKHFADTVPVTMPGALPGTSSQPARPGMPLRPASSTGSTGFEKLIEESRRNNRVCPIAAKWQELDTLLRASAPGAADSLAPLPPPDEWKSSTPLAKRLMFRSVIDWAGKNGQLETALRFVRVLPETQWHHMGD